MCRAVRRAADRGVRQFLDLGAGIPFSPNISEIAQDVAPESRVMYVDNDPVVLAHGRAMMDSGPKGAVSYLNADLRDAAAVLDDPLTRRTLDFGEPVAVVLVGVLHFIVDEDRPREVIGRFMEAMPSGSYLIADHAVFDYANALAPLRTALVHSGWRVAFRDMAEFREIAFAGLDLLDPGVVTASDWCPDPEDALDPRTSTAVAGGMASKP
jgi:hypothetical protein